MPGVSVSKLPSPPNDEGVLPETRKLGGFFGGAWGWAWDTERATDWALIGTDSYLTRSREDAKWSGAGGYGSLRRREEVDPSPLDSEACQTCQTMSKYCLKLGSLGGLTGWAWDAPT